jgi:hypothetical protein
MSDTGLELRKTHFNRNMKTANPKDMMVFKTLTDYTDWNKLIEHCDSLDELSGLEKKKAKRAFKVLQKQFGDSFLKSAFDARHPIFEYLINRAPWTRKWIIWFADAIGELKSQENHESLFARLQDAEKFPEALSVLEIACHLCRVGFTISVDPKVEISGGIKIPDLKACDVDNREEFFVEVSIQRTSEVEQEAWQTFERIHSLFWRSVPFIHYCGRVHKTLADKHLDQILKKVENILENCTKEGAFQEIVVKGVIEIGIAPEGDKEILHEWAVERGLKVGEFSGPSYDVNEVLRTKRTIRDEQRQLPRDLPNIVVVKNNNVFIHLKDVRATIGELEEEVYRHPHLLAAVVWGEQLGKAEDMAIMEDQHVFIRKSKASLITDQYIILFNKFCPMKVLAATITKVYNAFRT